MCGVAGVFRPEGPTGEDDAWVRNALERLRHRGPDGSGVNTWTAATHGHVRLAILDPEPRSDQPFIYGGVILSYVGECWNYGELRQMLQDFGRTFRTTGDTEVVAALLDWALPLSDVGLLGALRLMDWQGALAVTESVSGRTWLARDPIGETPLYVLAREGNLFGDGSIEWASERKAWDAPDAVNAVPVPPGHVWQLSDVPEPFYRLPGPGGGVGSPEEVLRLLREAVRKRLQADVPVCCLCSGGLDSSLILALVREQDPDVEAFHVTMANGPTADLSAAHAVADHLRVPLSVMVVPAPDSSALRESILTSEVVSKTQVEIGTLAIPLARRLRERGFRVVLSGEGADELFGGYGTLARRATGDARWSRERAAFLEKMGRSDLMRVNKTLFSAGVEPRTPFLDRDLIAEVLPLGVRECPAGKGLLKRAARGMLPEDVIRRTKLTFQGGAGVADAMDVRLAGRQRREYNEMARGIFGGLPRG
jgi:asparagine synthase (glutamine-hydrolysing)